MIRMFAMLSCLFVCLSGCSRQVRTRTKASNQGHRLTHYWVVHQVYYPGKKKVALFTHKKPHRLLGKISRNFARELKMQGSGFLKNGTLVQYVSSCRSRPSNCYRVRSIDRKRYPIGMGAAGNALLPFRSVAVDTRRISLGSRLYIPSLARYLKRAGLRHDGCFWADDLGSKVRGKQIDLFTGNRTLHKRFMKRPMPTRVSVYRNHSRCRHLRRRRIAQGHFRPQRSRRSAQGKRPMDLVRYATGT